jgi:hypothetical protein
MDIPANRVQIDLSEAGVASTFSPSVMKLPSFVEVALSRRRIALALPTDNDIAVCRDVYFAVSVGRRGNLRQ